MRAAVCRAAGAVQIEQVATPTIGPGEILVRVTVCGVCGSDLVKLYHGDFTRPIVLGHEVVGIVTELGNGVTRVRRGQRVVVAHHVPCYACHYCRHGSYSMCRTFKALNIDPGGFAEYIRVPALNVEHAVFPIPPGLSDEEAAFTEPIACCLRALKRAPVQFGDTVLVVGLGSIGLLMVALATLHRARVVGTDLLPDRLDLAKEFGAEVAVLAESEALHSALREPSEGRGADLAILTVGSPTAIHASLPLIRDGGTVLLFASDPGAPTCPIDVDELYHREITLMTSYSPSTVELSGALDFLRAGTIPVERLVTHRLPLESIAEAFRLTKAHQALKVAVRVSPEPPNGIHS